MGGREISHFIDSMYASKIDNNRDTLNFHTKEIIENYTKLEGESFDWNLLPHIRSKQDFYKWTAFGKKLENNLIFNELDLNENFKKVIYNYLSVAEILGYRPIKEAAIKSADLFIKKSQK